MVALVLDALAPFVAAAQRAAFRTCRTAAIGALDPLFVQRPAGGDLTAQGIGNNAGLFSAQAEIGSLPPPAEFAAPEPSSQARQAEFWQGRTRGREDGAEACQRFAVLLREEAVECHEACDDAGEAEALVRASAADGCAAFIKQLGPLEDPESDVAEPDTLAGLGVAP